MHSQKQKNITPTMHLLMFEYGGQTCIPLVDLIGLLGISLKTAQRKANSQSLPFPVFKSFDSNKSPYVVYISDLADYFDKRRNAANDEWQKMQVA